MNPDKREAIEAIKKAYREGKSDRDQLVLEIQSITGENRDRASMILEEVLLIY